MRDYSNKGVDPLEIQRLNVAKVFRVQHKTSLEGFVVKVDDTEEVQSVIQMHSNPINANLEDKLFMVLKEDNTGIHWGSYIYNYEDKIMLTLTNPIATDGVIIKTKVRECNATMAFTKEEVEYSFPVLTTNYLVYDDKTYTNDTKVFEEEDRRAIVVPYTEATSKLLLIDDVYINNENYRILKIERMFDAQEGKDGVLQLVVIRTTFGDILVNETPLKGVVRFARMKDKVLNSKSRELITEHNKVKSGDIITHTYERDSNGSMETRHYIVRSLVDMRLDYDITYIINCDAEFYMWDNIKRERVLVPCYVEDNRTRFREEWKQNVTIENSEYQIIIQNNKFTKKLGSEIQRMIIRDKAYEVVGVDDISLENAIYVGLRNSKIDPNKDNLELGIADFYDQYIPPVNSAIVGENEMIIGEEYTYYIEEVSVVNWEVSEDFVEIIEDMDNYIKLRIRKDSSLLGRKFTLTAHSLSTSTKEIEVSVW